MKKLIKKELLELVGGTTSSSTSSCEMDIGKRNVNKTAFCSCVYDDYNATKNINKVDSCMCDCVGIQSLL